MTHVLLWSQRQNALHIESVEEMLAAGRRAYGENRSSDYVPIAMGEKDAMHQVADSIRCTLAARETLKRWRAAV